MNAQEAIIDVLKQRGAILFSELCSILSDYRLVTLRHAREALWRNRLIEVSGRGRSAYLTRCDMSNNCPEMVGQFAQLSNKGVWGSGTKLSSETLKPNSNNNVTNNEAKPETPDQLRTIVGQLSDQVSELSDALGQSRDEVNRLIGLSESLVHLVSQLLESRFVSVENPAASATQTATIDTVNTSKTLTASSDAPKAPDETGPQDDEQRADRDETIRRFVTLCVTSGMTETAAEAEALKFVNRPLDKLHRAVAHVVLTESRGRLKGSPVAYVYSTLKHPDWKVDAVCVSPWKTIDAQIAAEKRARGEYVPPPKPEDTPLTPAQQAWFEKSIVWEQELKAEREAKRIAASNGSG